MPPSDQQNSETEKAIREKRRAQAHYPRRQIFTLEDVDTLLAIIDRLRASKNTGKHAAVVGTYPQPEHGWVCYHCGETFTTWGAARDHFGETPEVTTGCLLRVQPGEERGLLMTVRRLERDFAILRASNAKQEQALKDIESLAAEHLVAVARVALQETSDATS